MTTIVCKDGVMCSDSQVTRGDMIDNTDTKKIYEVEGCLVGISGSLVGAMKFVDWFRESIEYNSAIENFPIVKIPPPEDLVNKDFHCLVMYPNKEVYEFFGTDEVSQVTTPYCAVGSGMIYALPALDAGVSAQEAVQIAIGRDVFSGGMVQTFEVSPILELTEDYLGTLDKKQLSNLILTGSIESEEEVIETLQEDVHSEEETEQVDPTKKTNVERSYDSSQYQCESVED